MDAAHQGEIGVGEQQRHELALFHADAVLTGQAAADFDAVADDFCGDVHRMLELLPVARIEKYYGVEIAVAGVKNVADVEAVLSADFVDATESLLKLRARNYSVENIVAGSNAAKCAEGVFAAFPEEIALFVVARDTNFAGVVLAADFVNGRGLDGDRFGKSFDFDQ
jgi:hypothetical protein